MLEALLVTFREGLESFLIISVIAAYLRRTQRQRLLVGLRIGLGASVVTCVVGAFLWGLVPNQSLYEGIAALAAAALVGALLWQMLRMGRRMKGEIEARIARMAGDGPGAGAHSASPAAIAGVALVTTLLLTREGLEAVLYLGIQARMAGDRPASLAGAAMGLALAGAIAWTWNRYAHVLNLKIILRVTAVFLSLFLFQLVMYGVHELAESGIIEGSEGFHDATEVFGPDGWIGHLISYSLLGAPLLYLVWNRRDRLAAARRSSSSTAAPAS
jgi:high-affinity iron transporter